MLAIWDMVGRTCGGLPALVQTPQESGTRKPAVNICRMAPALQEAAASTRPQRRRDRHAALLGVHSAGKFSRGRRKRRGAYFCGTDTGFTWTALVGTKHPNVYAGISSVVTLLQEAFPDSHLPAAGAAPPLVLTHRDSRLSSPLSQVFLENQELRHQPPPPPTAARAPPPGRQAGTRLQAPPSVAAHTLRPSNRLTYKPICSIGYHSPQLQRTHP
ncbi:PREDICTED: uncharacterized protein LOC106724028 [Myotis brandtii]|uniref:uncharacterized protein LOC106724028 n=1 Tax=Myotis brandtii TaxID=109478 RepID=UPI00070456CB|nr:PREDICTED: uncharacterized protein LOC106724028 [Myotis brandtii]